MNTALTLPIFDFSDFSLYDPLASTPPSEYFSSEPFSTTTTTTTNQPTDQNQNGTHVPESSDAPEIWVLHGTPYMRFEHKNYNKRKRVDSKKHVLIRIDIESVGLHQISDEFKHKFALYPKAMVDECEYKGTRYNYESECNYLGWKLAYLNQPLQSQKGLIQQAVEMYRNVNCHLFPKSRPKRYPKSTSTLNGSRVVSQHQNQTPSTGSSTPLTNSSSSNNKPEKLILQTNYGSQKQMKLKLDFEKVNLTILDDEFKSRNAVFPRAYEYEKIKQLHELFTYSQYQVIPAPPPNHEFEMTLNQVAWKLTYLNKKVLDGKKAQIQRAVDLYRARFMAPENSKWLPRRGRSQIWKSVKSNTLQPNITASGCHRYSTTSSPGSTMLNSGSGSHPSPLSLASVPSDSARTSHSHSPLLPHDRDYRNLHSTLTSSLMASVSSLPGSSEYNLPQSLSLDDIADKDLKAMEALLALQPLIEDSETSQNPESFFYPTLPFSTSSETSNVHHYNSNVSSTQSQPQSSATLGRSYTHPMSFTTG
ncbi:hypothetical protein BKA69DRAFT_1125542 [Paraphysoderma sedebokerense]|nr:hypothetical protein BKA69DRAFT_1125542 [Paraphysoderma sedebokerense]